MVEDGRGGFCFEQNLLLRHALKALGFHVTGLSARVVSNRPPGNFPPRTHMLLRVDFDGHTYIADGGFGGMTLTEPLRLEVGTPQQTTHERRRLLQDGEAFTREAEAEGEWKTYYRFNSLPQRLVDDEMANWYICTHPNSQFNQNLIVARPTAQARYALRNNSLAIHHLDGPTERTTLTSAGELRDTLEDIFRIRLPESPELDAELKRLAAKRPENEG